MNEAKGKVKAQDRREHPPENQTDSPESSTSPEVSFGNGKRQLTRADDDRVYYTTLRQANMTRNGRSNKNGNGRTSNKPTGNGLARKRNNSQPSSKRKQRGNRF